MTISEFFASIDWTIVRELVLYVILAATYFLLFRSVPAKVFDKLVDSTSYITDAIPGNFDELIRDAVAAELRKVLVEQDETNTEGETPDA